MRGKTAVEQYVVRRRVQVTECRILMVAHQVVDIWGYDESVGFLSEARRGGGECTDVEIIEFVDQRASPSDR